MDVGRGKVERRAADSIRRPIPGLNGIDNG